MKNKTRKYETRTCKACNKEFTVRSDSKTIYCSSKCFGNTMKKRNPKRCLTCGAEFIRRYDSVYCSNKCARKAISMPVEVTCEYCGKKFIRNPSGISNHNFCSNLCRILSARENPITGERQPNWNNGMAHMGGYIFVKQGYKSYKQEHRIVMERALGRLLNSDEIVHHIDGDKTNNAVENLELTNRSDHARLHTTGRRWKRKMNALNTSVRDLPVYILK